jgi:hypothetical protein
MSEVCAQCGALLPKEHTCQTIHNNLLIFESDNSIPHSIHFLHVTCFMVQHNLYSDEGLIWAQSMLQNNLAEDMTEQQHLHFLRTDGKSKTSRTRTWKFSRSTDAPPLPKVAWAMTIVNVSQQAQNAEQYCKQVRQWAHMTLQQLISLQR